MRRTWASRRICSALSRCAFGLRLRGGMLDRGALGYSCPPFSTVFHFMTAKKNAGCLLSNHQQTIYQALRFRPKGMHATPLGIPRDKGPKGMWGGACKNVYECDAGPHIFKLILPSAGGSPSASPSPRSLHTAALN